MRLRVPHKTVRSLLLPSYPLIFAFAITSRIPSRIHLLDQTIPMGPLLSDRQLKIAELVARGFKNLEIAHELKTSSSLLNSRRALDRVCASYTVWGRVLPVASRTATSIMLLSVLVAGMATPAGACALMCVRHQRAESQPHCGQPSHAMPRIGHNPAAMSHAAVEAMSPVLVSQSCQTNCFTAERLAVSRKTVLQVTPVQSSAVVLDITSKYLTADLATSSRLVDGTPPKRFSVYAASFSILRI